MGKPPPQTVRYCLHCQKNTKFKYDHFIGHSYCSECGRSSQFSTKKLIKGIGEE